MIINKLRLEEEHPMTGPAGSWPLPLYDFNLDSSAGENGYILKDAKGLGPPVFTSIVKGFDSFGVPIMGNDIQKRIIILKIGLEPKLGQSFGTLRDELYKLISRSVLFSLMHESTILAQTTGFIRQVEPVHFSSQPEIEIVIECEDGDFVSPDTINIPLSTLATLEPVINYEEGNAPTGLTLQFTYTAVADGTGFTIFNHSNFWHAGEGPVFNVFEVSYPFETDDVVTITTQSKNQRITLLRAAVESDLAGYINPGAIWPELYPGVNAFEWDFDASWMDWVNVSYNPRFWGV